MCAPFERAVDNLTGLNLLTTPRMRREANTFLRQQLTDPDTLAMTAGPGQFGMVRALRPPARISTSPFGPASEYGETALYRQAGLDEVRAFLSNGLTSTGNFVTPNREIALSQKLGANITMELSPSIAVRPERSKPGLAMTGTREYTVHGNPEPRAQDVTALIFPPGSSLPRIQRLFGPTRSDMFDWGNATVLEDGAIRVPSLRAK